MQFKFHDPLLEEWARQAEELGLTMTYEIPGQQIPLQADTSIVDTSTASFQYRGVVVLSTGLAGLPASGGIAIQGVLQNKPLAVDNACTIMINGVTKAVCSAAIAAGASVMVDTAGKFLTATGSNVVCGIALEAAVNVGDLFPMQLVTA